MNIDGDFDGGAIEVVSAKGDGTTITVSLPIDQHVGESDA